MYVAHVLTFLMSVSTCVDVSSPRSKSLSGNALPSPRTVSTAIHFDASQLHTQYTLMVMQWGQFLDHDLTFTPMYEGPGGQPLDCAACDSATSVHPACLPIPIPPNDPFFPNSTCISFARSLAGQLTLGRREQLNQVTSYLDASNVYGSDACEARILRTFVGGRLNVTKHPLRGKKDLLPQTADNKECRAPSGLCFLAGIFLL
ncbi:hypothetical protein LAZ67_2004110 [Cordylochernes scorpioides]|uniref:Peroxidase n=1 Tax=Cordylochernes scorpioides TaxID=51811 RepID=A0ABY6K3J5_9ARAC|nr:hypothetical protein LAZ67_2004110 [Cordylochernes scorpioides]